MEGQIVEMANEGVSTSHEEPANTPSVGEESPTSEAGESKPESSAQKRIQKLANENRQYKENLQKMEAKLKAIAPLEEWDGWLRQNPHYAKELQEWLDPRINGKKQEAKEDPYKDFSPEVQAKFRELDDLRSWKTSFEQRQEQERVQNEQRSVSDVQNSVDDQFRKYLQEDGFTSKDGAYEESVVEYIEDAVLARLMRSAENPQKPTLEELKTAYEAVVKKGIPSLQKHALKNSKRGPNVPASGSNRGIIPPKGRQTAEQRIAQMASEL